MPYLPSCFTGGRIVAAMLLSTCLSAAVAAHADSPELQLTQISDQSKVVDIANAGDGSNRLFLVNQDGLIYVVEDGNQLQDPFLDIDSRVNSIGNERGLLSMAFAPDYGNSGYFYVWYTESSGDTVLARYQVSDTPNLADAASEEIILEVEQPFGNHNGGRLRFGPDGMLYLGLGDGGGAGDPGNLAQFGGTLLGKLIRIDVDPVHGTYAIPPDNPFVGDGAVRDEIWAGGLRNPWRISFDSETGDLYIADVGQDELEEVNFQTASSAGGENYGWSIMEGSECFNSNNCDQGGLTLPVSEYDHGEGCSITGGEVYRGLAYPDMAGLYFYGDFCQGTIWGLEQQNGEWISAELLSTNLNISTFGLGEDGSLYVAGRSGGVFLVSDGEVVSEPVFGINPGFNDAWFEPATNGQGFFVVVYEDIQQLFLGWFTYDTERPPGNVMAKLGEPGHRWITAQGPYSGNTATLEAFLSSGGVFDSPEPPVPPPDKIGTITVTWTDCNSGVVTYDFPDLGLSGSVPIQRIWTSNVVLCEALQ